VKDVRCGYEGGCAGQTRKHTLGCTADIWDQLLLGCAGGAWGSVDLQLLDLTPDRVCLDHWRRHFSMYLCRLRAFPSLRSECLACSEYDECGPCSVILGRPASAAHWVIPHRASVGEDDWKACELHAQSSGVASAVACIRPCQCQQIYDGFRHEWPCATIGCQGCFWDSAYGRPPEPLCDDGMGSMSRSHTGG